MSTPEPRLVFVISSLADAAQARDIAHRLVTERLAACAQVSGAVTSTYTWKEAVQTETEYVLHCKTTADRAPALVERLRALHPYETPEIATVPAERCDPAYLAWVRASTAATASR